MLSGKITMVIGGSGPIGKAIVQSFLMENARVIVPLSSSDEVMELKQHLSKVTSGELITFLTDLTDYSKASEIASEIIDEFGKIDLAVTAINNCCSNTTLAKIDINDWQRMVEKNITPFFISSSLMLSFLSDETAMYVTLSDFDRQRGDNKNVLGSVASSIQVKMAEIIATELKGIKARYHHIFLHKSFHCGQPTDQHMLGDHIIQLYIDGTSKYEEVFLDFPSSTIPSEFMSW